MKGAVSSRLLSLDVLRGITIAGMLLVNNPGSWSYVYAPLEHAPWNGLTPTDLVFPFFIFIMGVSMYLSYQKYDFRLSGATFLKLFKRAALLFCIGVLLNWFGLFCRTLSSLRVEDMSLGAKLVEASVGRISSLRLLGVLQRLALVSFFGTLLLLALKPKRLSWFIAVLLVGYGALLLFTDSLGLSSESIVARFDRAVLGESHMYKLTGEQGPVAFDPEGLLSTIPCLAHVLLGVLAGSIVASKVELNQKVERLFLFGTLLFFAGALLSYALPVNKSIWSSTYVLECCGLASLLLAVLLYVIDVKGYKRWTRFFETFGVNPLFLFVLGGVISNLISNIGYSSAQGYSSLKGHFYSEVLQPWFGSYMGSCLFALCFVVVCWCFGHLLYKRHIFIKL